MTTEDLINEWRYRYAERIGMLVGQGEPTIEQKELAGREADEAISQLRQQQHANLKDQES